MRLLLLCLLPFAFCLFPTTATIAADPLSVVSSKPDDTMTALFASQDGWIGGDGADSVELSENRTAWLFSDTWVGKVRGNKRLGEGIVNNTVAIQTGFGEKAKIEFIVRRDDAGKAIAFITPDDGRGFFWMRAATVANDKLYMFLSQDELTPDGGALGFAEIGAWLAIVENPNDHPPQWKIEQKKIPHAAFEKTSELPWGSAAIQHDGHLYIYGVAIGKTTIPQSRELVVARVPLTAIDDFTQWQFLSNGEWQNKPDNLTRLVPEMSNEASVTFLPGLKKFVLIYTKGGHLPPILACSADNPWGPWSEPVEAYVCPESEPARRVFAYEGKGRRIPGTDDELLISYLTNAMDFATVANDATLYYPKFVRVKFANK